MEFEIGSSYLRREINGALGGQVQGGISTPRRSPVVILFTGQEGNAYGYRDEWKEDGFFHYTGEGQIGSMKMTKGNLAIREHAANGKVLMLFRKSTAGRHVFEGYMEYVTHYSEELPDLKGDRRNAIIFKLRPVPGPTDADAPAPVERQTLGDLRDRAIAASTERVDKTTRASVYRDRSRAVASYVVERAAGFCEGCGLPAPFLRKNGSPYLETHHIHRVSDEGPDKPSAVMALCPTCHRRVHSGQDGKAFNVYLARVPARIEDAYSAGRLKVVTAAIISDSKGRVLVAERGRGKLTGFWEFPGGKIQEGERPEACVVREIREELQIQLDDVEPFAMVDHDYPDFVIRLMCFTCTTSEKPVLTEHREVRWVFPEQMAQVNFAEADAAVARRLLKRSGATADLPIAADRARGERC